MSGSRIAKTLIDGGSGLNVIFTNTLRMMGLNVSKALELADYPFYGIVLSNTMVPLGQITLSVTFGMVNNYRTKFIKFEVTHFESSYNAINARPGLAMFMATPPLHLPGVEATRAQRGHLLPRQPQDLLQV